MRKKSIFGVLAFVLCSILVASLDAQTVKKGVITTYCDLYDKPSSEADVLSYPSGGLVVEILDEVKGKEGGNFLLIKYYVGPTNREMRGYVYRQHVRIVTDQELPKLLMNAGPIPIKKKVHSKTITNGKIFVLLKDANVRERPTTKSQIVGKGQEYDIIKNVELTADKKWVRYQVPMSRQVATSEKAIGYIDHDSLDEAQKKEIITIWEFIGDEIVSVRGQFVRYTGRTFVSDLPWVNDDEFRVVHETRWYEAEFLPTTEIVFIDRYIHKSLGQISNDMYRAHQLIENEIKRKRAIERQSRIKERNWPAHIEKAVREKKVVFGMTKEQVIASWGKPNDINRTVTMQGTREQWVYGSYGSSSKPTFLYFENGKLTAWQD